VSIIFADNAIRNSWLRVRMLPTPRTGLSAPDVFYVGNAVGETGNRAVDTVVNALDVSRVRSNLFATSVPIGSAFDMNRDGRVNATDLLLTRSGQSAPALPLITPPVL
jgi:hypothetical protein